MGSQQNKIQAVFDWQDAPQPFVPHHGKQAGSIRRVRRKKKGKHAKVEAELYICKEYSLAGVNSAHANGSRYVFGEYYVLGELLKGLKHPNIIDCVDFSYSPNSQVARLYTEYCRFGDLEQALRTRKARSKLDTQEAKHVLYQIACGLLYLHHGVYYTGNTLKIVSLPSVVREGDAPNGWVPILHRDIKPPNVFVAELADTCIQVKLGDFGIAKTETDGTDTYIGSRAYHAPEQRMEFQGPGRRRTTFKSDMYALGVTMQQVTIPNEEHLGASAEHAVILNQIIQDCLASNDIDRPSSGAIIDLLRPHIDSEDPSTITSKVLTRLTTSDTRGLTKQQAIRLKAEFTSYDELCQRCLHSGSNPGPEALLSFSSYVEDHAFPAWKSQAIQQVLPSMQPCLQGLVRDGGNGPHNNNAGVTRADPSPADTDKTARRDTNEDSIKDPITGPILSQLPAVSQSSLSILDSREREENEKAAEMHMLHELSSLPQVSSSGVPVRMLRSPEHLYHPYKPGVESSSGTPEPRLYSDWRTRYKLAQPHINFFSDGGDAHVNKPLQSSFVRAVKKNNANGILDSSGNAVDFSRRASPGPIPSTRRLGPSEPPTAPPSEHLRPVLERPAKTHPDARAKIAEAVARQKEEEAQLEREIEEMEIREREEEERERVYQEKKAAEKAQSEAKAEAERSQREIELKRREREAEALEEARERERERDGQEDESKSLFAALKKGFLGSQSSTSAAMSSEAGITTSYGSDTHVRRMKPPDSLRTHRPKPARLKLELNLDDGVWPPEPTLGLMSLMSSRFLEVAERVRYPDGIRPPNLSLTGHRKGYVYDVPFSLQFRDVFKEKPSMRWDERMKEVF